MNASISQTKATLTGLTVVILFGPFPTLAGGNFKRMSSVRFHRC